MKIPHDHLTKIVTIPGFLESLDAAIAQCAREAGANWEVVRAILENEDSDKEKATEAIRDAIRLSNEFRDLKTWKDDLKQVR